MQTSMERAPAHVAPVDDRLQVESSAVSPGGDGNSRLPAGRASDQRHGAPWPPRRELVGPVMLRHGRSLSRRAAA
jgi:hypothetical protein